MSKICYIVGAGEIEGCTFEPDLDDFVIAADGGYLFLEQEGIAIDLIVGDFDSLGQVPVHDKVMEFPAEKDDTDMMIAIKEGITRGYEEFIIYGGLGGRLSHSLGNIQLLSYLSHQGMRGYLRNKNSQVTVITNGNLAIAKGKKGYLSIFALEGEAKGVTLKGLKYPLERYMLTSQVPLGISNEFMNQDAEIIVEDGSLCIVFED